MKTKSIVLAALVTLSAVMSAAAATPSDNVGFAIVPVKGSEIYKVVYKGENEGKVKLNLYNAASKLIFSETILITNGFIRPLNFRGLEPGQYTVELVGAAGKMEKKIDFATAQDAAIKYAHVGRISAERNKYVLSVISNTKAGDKVSVKIYNANGLIYTSSQPLNGDFAQVYNVKDYSGSVTFEISDETGKVTTKSF